MSTQQEIYAAGSKNRPPMLNKENYVSWSSRLLRYAKSKPKEKLIYNSIMHDPHVKRMIPEPGDPDREVPIAETFHEQTDEELTEKEQMMKGSDIRIQEKKAKLFNEWEKFTFTDGESIESYYHQWSQHVTIVHQTKDLHEVDYTQLYDFLKYNQVKYAWENVGNQNGYNAVQNVGNQVVLNAVQNPGVQNVGNQNGLLVVPGIANQNANQNGNGNVVAARAEVRPRRRDVAYLQTQLLIAQKEEAGIQLHAEEFDLMATAGDLDKIEEVNANCILMANLQQASTSRTVRFGNDHIAAILGYGDLQWGNILITKFYFVKGLGHNLFSVGQFCDSDLEWMTTLVIREVHFLRSKYEALEVIKTFLKKIQVLLQAPVIIVRSDNGTEFKNQVLKEYFDEVGISHQSSSVSTPQKNGVIERRNRMLVEAARTMLIFSCAPLFLWVEAIAMAKPDISFLHVFGALCYPKNNREDIRKRGVKGDIGFFIGYSANSFAYRVYNRRTKKIMETINVTFDELSTMAFEQRSSKPGLQSMTSGQISSGLDLTYAPSTITSQKPTERELDLLFEEMYDDYIGGQPSVAPRPAPATLAPQDVDELEPQQHVQHQDNQAPPQPEIVADNVPNAMFDGDVFENPFAPPSTGVVESSSSQYVDPLNMHTFLSTVSA
ncbi:retrovirus-related pol polyprotein from transposon TNT 1-94 [Tanacetum coccineum]